MKWPESLASAAMWLSVAVMVFFVGQCSNRELQLRNELQKEQCRLVMESKNADAIKAATATAFGVCR